MKIAKRSNSTEDLTKAKRKRNEVLKLIRHAKSAFIQECSNQTQNDCKKFWEKVNVLLPSGPNTSTIHLEDKVDNVSPISTQLTSYMTFSRLLVSAWRPSLKITGYTLVKCQSWKKANIIPLQEGGDRSDVTNLRPISLLPVPGKLLERIVHTKTNHYLEANGILNEKQGGFHKRHSTTNTIADFTDDIANKKFFGLWTTKMH